MRNGLARHVKTNIKNTKKQNTGHGQIATGYGLHNADCCDTCRYSRGGYFSDTVHCSKHDVEPFKVHICDMFERRE